MSTVDHPHHQTWLVRLLVRLLIALVWLYRLTLAPLIGILFGSVCRFEPSCSQYMIEALRKYGPVRGLLRGIARVGRCHPWHPGGYDPP